MNTGPEPVASKAGLVTTLAYRIGDEPPAYALEGSIAITGALVQWLRDNLGLIRESGEVEALARSVEDNGGVYVVPAFSGLYAPHWRDDARGLIIGLTRYANKGHIARACLEATAYQTREVLEAMERDSGITLGELRCDGGMVVNDLLMQFQADILDRETLRPKVSETTALGAAYAAGLATGFWGSSRTSRTIGRLTGAGIRISTRSGARPCSPAGAGRWSAPSAGWRTRHEARADRGGTPDDDDDFRDGGPGFGRTADLSRPAGG